MPLNEQNPPYRASGGGLDEPSTDLRIIYSIDERGHVVNLHPALSAWQRLTIEADRRAA